MSDKEPEAAADRVVLHYTGDGEAHAHGVPARHLTEADIARLVFVGSIPASGSDGLRPEDAGFAKARAAKIDELSGLPIYRKSAPKE